MECQYGKNHGSPDLRQRQEAQWLHPKKTLEINPFHPIVKELNSKISAAGENDVDAPTKDLAQLLYDAALVQSGFAMKEVNEFASRIHRVVAQGLNVDPNEEPTIPQDDEEPDVEQEEQANEEPQHGGGDGDHEEL